MNIDSLKILCTKFKKLFWSTKPVGIITFFLLFFLVGNCISCDSQNKVSSSSEDIKIPFKGFEITAKTIRSGTEFKESKSHFIYDVSVHRITYKVEYKGENITLSGAIAIPIGVESPPILVENHGTLQKDSWAPSHAYDSGYIYKFITYASAGYIVFAPDHIGFGESKDKFHPWLLPRPGAISVVGMLKEGIKLLDQYKQPYSNKIFLTGFSEGANIAMGAQKQIEEDGVYNLVASSLVSGAYDLDFTVSKRILGESPLEIFGGAYMIVTLRAYYDWTEPLTTYFKEPYASELQSMINEPGAFEDALFDRNRLILKDIIQGKLNNKSLFNASFIADFKSNPNNKVKQKLIENNEFKWKPTIPMILHYGKKDFTAYFENSIRAHKEFLNRGADPNIINIVGYKRKDHEESEHPAMKATLEWFETFK